MLPIFNVLFWWFHGVDFVDRHNDVRNIDDVDDMNNVDTIEDA